MQNTPDRSALHSARLAYSERLGDSFSNRSAKFLIEKVEMLSEDYILDVATGPGTVIFESLCKFDNPPFFAGVDMSTDMLRGANHILANLFPMPEIRVDFEQGDAHGLPFGDDVFDTVVSNLGIHLFSDKLLALREMHRVLKPGGRLGLSIPYLIPESFQIEAVINRLPDDARDTLREYGWFTGIEYTIMGELNEKLSAAGFAKMESDETVVPYPCVGAQEAFGLIKTVLYFSGKVPSAQYSAMFSGIDKLSANPSVYTDMETHAVMLGVARVWCTKPEE